MKRISIDVDDETAEHFAGLANRMGLHFSVFMAKALKNIRHESVGQKQTP